MKVPVHHRLARAIGPWVLFASLAIGSTHPLALQFRTHVPQGKEPSATVPLLNLWTIWWNVECVGRGYRGYWDAPIYHPVPEIFAASEPQTVVGWLAWPLWQLLPGAAPVYNALVIAFLTLNGWFAYQLLRRLRLSWAAGLSGGAMIVTLPLVHWELGVFQLIALWGILWTLWALMRFQCHSGPGPALHLAIAFAATYSLCCYFGLFLSMLLLVCTPLLLGSRLRRGRTWLWGAVSVTAAGAMLAPVIIAQLRFAWGHPIEYPREWFHQLSASPVDYLRTPWSQLVSLPDLRHEGVYSWPLSPGTLKTGMALVGLVLGMSTPRRRRASLMLGTMLTAAVLLSMGPRLEWGGWSLYRPLAAYYPGFGHARNLFRFAFFVQLAAALLAAVGLHALHVWLQRRAWCRARRRLVSTAVLVLGLLLACEAWPRSPLMYPLPANRADSRWITWLCEDGREAVCLAFFPQPADYDAAASETTGVWMYYQTFHARRMINGYTTFVPLAIERLRKQLATFPDAKGVQALQEAGVTHVVLDVRAGAVSDMSAMQSLGMRQVVDDTTAGMEIWELPGSAMAVGGK